MPSTDTTPRSKYWVELSYDGHVLGGGLLIQRGGVILTAAHCLRTLPAGEDQLYATLGTGLKLKVRVDEIVDWDLALLVAVDPDECDVPPPCADACRSSDEWFAPYRPSITDPHLNGHVLSEDCVYGLTGGTEVVALQLGVNQMLGNYSGYSGGPVEADPGGRRRLVGVLLEQYPDRTDPDRSSNVLFAARIQQAIQRFRRFDMANLFPGGVPERPAPPRPDVDAAVESRLRKLREWRETEVISSRAAKAIELRILQDWLRATPLIDTDE
ncbi:trypsin-like serine protease [Actinoplanes sp. NPDC000266]